MTHTDPRETDVATVADRSVVEAIAVPPDDLPDDPRAYLRWLRDPARPVRRPKPQPLRLVPEPADHGPHETRDPAYAAASAQLRALPDLGGASLKAARAELRDAVWEDLVIHAAAHPVQPPADNDGYPRTTTDTQRPGTDAPACQACETALDPDGTCWTCTTTGAPR